MAPAPDLLPPGPPVGDRPLPPGKIGRVVLGVTTRIASAVNAFFGPQQPIKPAAQQTLGRQFDYPAGYNTRITPRGGELFAFDELRALADAHTLTRLAIETRKDQMTKQPWSIVPRSKKPTPKDLERAKCPLPRPRAHARWQRMALEEVRHRRATIEPAHADAARTARIVDGATITRKIEDGFGAADRGVPAGHQGRGGEQPDHGRPALPAANLRANRIYGFSPVEQIIFTINMAPGAISRRCSHTGARARRHREVDPSWTTENIKEFQDYWDGPMTPTATKRKLKFVPR
jgi:hypothetical protein